MPCVLDFSVVETITKSKLLFPGSIDPWEPKVLRAGMGAHFHIPIITTGWELIANYLPSNSDLYLLSNKAPSSEEEKPSKVPRSILQQVLVDSSNETGPGEQEQSVDESYLKRRDLKVFQRLRLPVHSYETVDYARNGETSIGLVVGSDDNGSSPEAKKFAFGRGGEMVFVPGASDEAITSSVVLFEIRRQLKRRNSQETVATFNEHLTNNVL